MLMCLGCNERCGRCKPTRGKNLEGRREKDTYDVIIRSVLLTRLCGVDQMMGGTVNAKDKRFLKSPRSDIFRKLRVTRLHTSDTRNVENSSEDWEGNTYFEISLLANVFENNRGPPTQVTRPPSTVWKPATTARELPAQRPSPPLSVASTSASGPASASAAKLSSGAFKIGNKSGLSLSAKGTPENQTGAVLGVNKGEDDTEIGMTVDGSSRSGK